MKKLLFISSYDSSFVKSDIRILVKHFQVTIPDLINIKRNKSGMFKIIYKVILGVIQHDLVFCWFADFPTYIAVKVAKLLGKKVFIVVGGYEVSNLPGYGGLTDPKRAERIRYILRNATKIITVSDFSKVEIDTLNLGIAPLKISIGVEPEKNIAKKSKLILTSGTANKDLYQIKGLDVFAKATIGFPDYTVKIIGFYDEEIKQKLLKINPKMQFTGKLTHQDCLEMISSARVYCQLSQRESFGLAILEAMNLGCIPIISKAGAMPEIVGNLGFTCEYGDVGSTKQAIREAISSDSQEAIRSRMKEYFSNEMREEKLINLIMREL
jgi:glycosyltransferase involved in cell wall biosynthesis